MKTTIIMLIALSALTLFAITAKADYTLKIPLESDKGGAIPTGSVQFKTLIQLPHAPVIPAEIWQPAEPLYGEWVNIGDIYGCSNWTPESNTYEASESITQIATDCKQDQTRSIQDREQETTTLTIRNKGIVVTETQPVTVSSTRTATGTLTLPINCRFSRIKTPWSTTTHLVFKNPTNIEFNFVWAGAMWATEGESESIFAGAKYYAGQFITTEGRKDLYAICKETL